MPFLKKYIFTAILAFCVLLAPGCSGNSGESLSEKQQDITGASVRWEYGGREYAADITLDGEMPENTEEYRASTVTVTSPEEISGLTLTFSGDGATVSVGGVSLSLPENTGEEVYRIVRSLSLYPEERKGAGNGSGTVTAIRYEAPLYGGITEYDITYGDDKYPKSAAVTWDGGEMTVKYEGFVYGMVESSASDVN